MVLHSNAHMLRWTKRTRWFGCVLEGKSYTSIEIDRIFSASKAQGKSLYYVDEPLLASIAPDIIFTQDVCEVCQIDTACTAAAVSKLEKQPQLCSAYSKYIARCFSNCYYNCFIVRMRRSGLSLFSRFAEKNR